MSYLRYLFLLAYSGVQHILCCVFVLFFSSMLPVSLDYPFLIVPFVFSSVYFKLVVYQREYHQTRSIPTRISPNS